MGGRLVYVGHATVLVELDCVRLLTDPVLRGRILHLRRRVPPPAPLGELGAILISHVHYDHLDVPSLKSLDPGVPMVAPCAAELSCYLRVVVDKAGVFAMNDAVSILKSLVRTMTGLGWNAAAIRPTPSASRRTKNSRGGSSPMRAAMSATAAPSASFG